MRYIATGMRVCNLKCTSKNHERQTQQTED